MHRRLGTTLTGTKSGQNLKNDISSVRTTLVGTYLADLYKDREYL